jgi:peroxiredoxin
MRERVRAGRLLAGAALLLGLAGAPVALAGQAANKPAAGFELVSVAGQTVRLADLRGKVVLIDFFASWCEPCMKELPELEKLAQQWKGRDVVFVGINLDREKKNALDLVNRFKLTFPVLLDPEGKTAERYDPPKMPSSYLIDREGVVRFVNEGFGGTADLAKLRKQLEQLSAAAAPPAAPPAPDAPSPPSATPTPAPPSGAPR